MPGFHFHEISVELEARGRLLSISGRKEDNFHETSKLDHDHDTKKDKVDKENGEKFEFISHTTTSFEQKFTIDPSIDMTLMTSNLVTGVEVRAPQKSIPRINRHIPVTQFDQDVWAELISSKSVESVED